MSLEQKSMPRKMKHRGIAARLIRRRREEEAQFPKGGQLVGAEEEEEQRQEEGEQGEPRRHRTCVEVHAIGRAMFSDMCSASCEF